MSGGRTNNVEARRTRITVTGAALMTAATLALAACGSGSGSDSSLLDTVAERGVAALAEGRWHCENAVTDEHPGISGGTPSTHLADVSISGDGRFRYEEVDTAGRWVKPMTGTWKIRGLSLELSVPWSDDGSTGFHEWTYAADADPPTRLTGRNDIDSRQNLKIEFGTDNVRLSQKDEGGGEGTNYGWDATCTRTSRDPGAIPPPHPPSDGG